MRHHIHHKLHRKSSIAKIFYVSNFVTHTLESSDAVSILEEKWKELKTTNQSLMNSNDVPSTIAGALCIIHQIITHLWEVVSYWYPHHAGEESEVILPVQVQSNCELMNTGKNHKWLQQMDKQSPAWSWYAAIFIFLWNLHPPVGTQGLSLSTTFNIW